MYIAQKPCTISGNKYFIGDVIDITNVDSKGLERLIKMKLIINADVEPDSAVTVSATALKDVLVTVPIIDDEGNADPIDLTTDEVALGVKILQLKAEDATKQMESVESESLCIFIHKLSPLKTVKTAAEKRVDELAEATDSKNADNDNEDDA